MIPGTERKSTSRPREEISDFHDLFRPYVERIYRGALILTGHPETAERLQIAIYLKAFMAYQQSGNVLDFENWLMDIVDSCFTQFKIRNATQVNELNLSNRELMRAAIVC